VALSENASRTRYTIKMKLKLRKCGRSPDTTNAVCNVWVCNTVWLLYWAVMTDEWWLHRPPMNWKQYMSTWSAQLMSLTTKSNCWWSSTARLLLMWKLSSSTRPRRVALFFNALNTAGNICPLAHTQTNTDPRHAAVLSCQVYTRAELIYMQSTNNSSVKQVIKYICVNTEVLTAVMEVLW